MRQSLLARRCHVLEQASASVRHAGGLIYKRLERALSEIAMHRGTELAGKVALVTGGARNIGRAICRSLAAGGAAVVVNALTSRAAGEETVKLIDAAGGKAVLVIADMTEPQAVAQLVEQSIERYGRLDLLVNNAAVRAESRFADITLEEWRRVVSSILDTTFLCTKACLPHLIRAGGASIVNIGGLTGHKGALHRAHVVAAKGGLAAMTKALALDFVEHDITVNCVVPGTVETQRGLPGAPERPDYRKSLPPAGRRGAPEEVAAIVRMLCGPDARYITGQSIHVNGGGWMP
jgi:3-oxoacyl-[acyl-carrier protein] reductase